MSDLVARSAGAWKIQTSAKAAGLLADSCTDGATLAQLKYWAPSRLLQALGMMSGPRGQQEAVRAYALRSLHTCPPEQVSAVTTDEKPAW